MAGRVRRPTHSLALRWESSSAFSLSLGNSNKIHPMKWTWLTEGAESRPARGGGFGVFAIREIEAGETVAVFGGALCSGQEFAGLSADRRSRSIQVEEDLFLVGGEIPEDGDLINHSCEPTCRLDGSSILVTMRSVFPGEELTYEYATSDGTPYDEFDCQCGSPLCRGMIRGSDWTRPDLQDRYKGWFSPYLARRIESLTSEQIRAARY